MKNVFVQKTGIMSPGNNMRWGLIFNVLRLIQIEREAVGERVWVISSKGAVRGR